MRGSVVRLLPFLILEVFTLKQGVSAVKAPPVPETPRQPVSTTYHGVTVTEDYQWLEAQNDPAVRAWSDAENRHARAILDAIPVRKTIAQRLKKIYSEKSVNYFALTYRPGRLFAIKNQPPKQQSFLVALKSSDDTKSEHVVVDPNALDPTGGTAIDFYVPSRDGRYVAVCLSEHGSEDGSVHVYDVASGKALGDVVPRVNYPTGGGSVAWDADGTGFYYTRYPQGNERPPEDANFYQQVYYHKLGTPASEDKISLGEDFPRIAETHLESSEDGKYVLATVANGDGGEFAFYVRGASGGWQQISTFADKITGAAFGPDDTLYLLSRQDAPRGQVLCLSLEKPELAEAEVIVPEGEPAIRGIYPAKTRLYVVDVLGGPSQIRVFSLDGKRLRAVPIPNVSRVGQLVHTNGDRILFYSETFTEPGAWYRYDGTAAKPERTALYRTSSVKFDDIKVVRAFATSKDGTKVPLTILMKKGTRRTGKNPTILYGYGGYGAVEAPGFSASRRLWFDAGGIFVTANIRGGGEYGEEWHLQGNLTKKQNVFDDFAAVAKYLIEQKYTNPQKLAIQGGSNGGLLMGAELTQHPDLFKAVVAWVGIYDSLRTELSPNGEFNITEFGTVKDEAQFRALYAYSPYHNVKDGTQYPATLFLTGENDGRVEPWQSRKMTARLQASGTKRPVLLRTSASSGHGIGTALDERIAQDADAYAFLFWQLGMTL